MKPAPAYAETAVRRVTLGQDDVEFSDVLAVEEPLEIRIGLRRNGKLEHRAISITMRTPGDDLGLAAGFLFTEGILNHPDQIARIRHCGIPGGNSTGREGVQPAKRSTPTVTNTVVVELNDNVNVDFKRLERNFYTTSSCGVCGKSSIEALHTGVKKLDEMNEVRVRSATIQGLPETLLFAQIAFKKTGGLHASVLFDLDGNFVTGCEDVGRHNALDKAIGRHFMAGHMPLSDKILMVSGRASFELVQKALMAGIPILAAVGAPSSLAVELASEFGMTLAGFVREGRFNIYTGAERIL